MQIYGLINKLNGKRYVGMTKGLAENRIKVHFQRNATPIQHAIKKYGFQNFSWKVLAIARTLDELKKKEVLWIRRWNCKSPNGYNLTDGGDGITGASIETRLKLSIANKGKKLRLGKKVPREVCRRIAAAIRAAWTHEKRKAHGDIRRGKRASKATRAKIRKNRYNVVPRGSHLTLSHRESISAGLKGRKLSAEHVRRVSKSLAGKPFTASHKAALINARHNRSQSWRIKLLTECGFYDAN